MTTPTTPPRRGPRWWVLPVLVVALAAGPGPPDGPQVPVALAWGPDGALRVALRDARQVATVDVKSATVVARRALPFRPAAVAWTADGARLVVGGQDGELLAVGPGGGSSLRGPTGRGPARVVALDGSRVAVAATWDPAVSIIDAADGRTLRTIALPFAPGAMVRRPDGRLVVADAFGGRLAGLDPETGRVRTRLLDGVNLHALAVSGDGKELLVAHMTQFNPVPVTTANIDSGLVLSSRLSAVRLSEFDGEGEHEGTPAARRRVTLDGSRHGAADPSAMAVSPDGGVVLMALAGAHQVLKNDRRVPPVLGDPPDLAPLGHNLKIETLEVGRSPLDVAFDPSGASAVTADAMSDTLTVVRVADLTVSATIRLATGPEPVARTAPQRGEAVFRDGRRALDRWMSCASCHPGGHTTGLNFDTLGDGSYGAPKNTPSLLGVGPTAPFAWTGRFPTLAGQVSQSIESSQHGPRADEATVADLTAYLETLGPPPPRRSPAEPAARRGAGVFQASRCGSCHKAPSFTMEGLKSVGTDDGEGGHRAFNPPTLRGIGWTAPYFHDGRAATLDRAIEDHHPGRKAPPGAADRDDLKAYLETL